MSLTPEQLSALVSEASRFAATYPAMRGTGPKPQDVELGYGSIKSKWNNRFAKESTYSTMFPLTDQMITDMKKLKAGCRSRFFEFLPLKFVNGQIIYVPTSYSWVFSVFGRGFEPAKIIERYVHVLEYLQGEGLSFHKFSMLSCVYSIVLAVVVIDGFSKDDALFIINYVASRHVVMYQLGIDVSTKKEKTYVIGGVPATAIPVSVRPAREAQAAKIAATRAERRVADAARRDADAAQLGAADGDGHDSGSEADDAAGDAM